MALYRWAWAWARAQAAVTAVSLGSVVAAWSGCATSDKNTFSVDYREPPLRGGSDDASVGFEAGGRSGGSGAGGASANGGKAGASSGGAGQPSCVDAECPAVGPLTGCCAASGICGVLFGTTCTAFPAGGAGGAPGAGGRNAGAGGGGGRGGAGGRGGTAGRGGAAGRGGTAGTGGRTPPDSGIAPNDAGDASD